MARTVHPRSAMALPIANVAFPTALILLVLLVAGVVTGGALFALVYLYRTYVRDRDSV